MNYLSREWFKLHDVVVCGYIYIFIRFWYFILLVTAIKLYSMIIITKLLSISFLLLLLASILYNILLLFLILLIIKSTYMTDHFLIVHPPSKKLVARLTSQSYLASASLQTSASKPISISCLILSSWVTSFAKFSVQVFAVYSNILRSYLYMRATSAS